VANETSQNCRSRNVCGITPVVFIARRTLCKYQDAFDGYKVRLAKKLAKKAEAQNSPGNPTNNCSSHDVCMSVRVALWFHFKLSTLWTSDFIPSRRAPRFIVPAARNLILIFPKFCAQTARAVTSVIYPIITSYVAPLQKTAVRGIW